MPWSACGQIGAVAAHAKSSSFHTSLEETQRESGGAHVERAQPLGRRGGGA